ncbi:hypothetical protein BBJ28_00003754 [Nothophytophthora sp. Chile5]|nr:hypothetical protein BBJ28_00003754 [Nothophytophthora sp. Chile5]
MEDLDEHAAAAGSHAPKNGQQMLSHLLAIAYHVLEETKYMNLKPPLRPTSKLFAPDAQVPGSPLQSPGGADSPQDDTHADMNGLAAGFAGSHAHPGGAGHPVVIPYSPEEIQDTYTKILALKNQYVKVSTELMETMKETGKKSTTEQADKVCKWFDWVAVAFLTV